MSAYQYVVLRCVPRPEREEFVNVGVVLFSPAEDYLDCRYRVDATRIHALDPDLEVAAVTSALEAIEMVCRGEAFQDLALGSRSTFLGGRSATDDASTRFGLLKAPRSTVVQPGPVHGGVTRDPAAELDRLLGLLVG